MTERISREEFYHAMGELKSGIGGVNERLDVLNGRTRKVEIATAVQWMLWVLAGASLGILGQEYVSQVVYGAIR